jgi:hypothetical protein
MTQPRSGAATGVSLSTANRAHMAYDHGGIKGAQMQAERRRQKKALLARFAKTAGRGEMLRPGHR